MTADFTVALLTRYSFDRSGYTAGELMSRWLNDYPVNWVRLAVVEALYQGRYKAISVEQILAFWNRRGQALYHFNHEFERLICGSSFQPLSRQPDTITTPAPPVLNSDVYAHNRRNALCVTTQAGDGEKSVQFTEATAIPATLNHISEEHVQKRSYHSVSAQRSRFFKSGSTMHNSTNYPPIQQFTPQTDSSDFHIKLKAIVQRPQV